MGRYHGWPSLAYLTIGSQAHCQSTGAPQTLCPSSICWEADHNQLTGVAAWLHGHIVTVRCSVAFCDMELCCGLGFTIRWHNVAQCCSVADVYTCCSKAVCMFMQ